MDNKHISSFVEITEEHRKFSEELKLAISDWFDQSEEGNGGKINHDLFDRRQTGFLPVPLVIYYKVLMIVYGGEPSDGHLSSPMIIELAGFGHKVKVLNKCMFKHALLMDRKGQYRESFSAIMLKFLDHIDRDKPGNWEFSKDNLVDLFKGKIPEKMNKML